MKDNIKVLALAALSMVVCACGLFKTKPEEELPLYSLSEEIRDYVSFDVGSWWVYENSVGEIDSVRIIKFQNGITGDKKIGYRFENIGYDKHSSYYTEESKDVAGNIYNGLLRGVVAPGPYFEDSYLCSMDEGYHTSANPPFDYIFFSDTTPGFEFGGGWETGVTVRYKEQMEAFEDRGFVFEDVRVFESNQPKHALSPKEVWHARGVGVIRKELFDGTVWELIDYEVVKP